MKRTDLKRDKNFVAPLPDYGKIPPQTVDMEEAVLGAILVDSSIFDEISQILTAEMFYKDTHQKIYSAAFDLYKARKITDLISVTDQLRENGDLESVGGPVYITQLTSKVNSTAVAPQHALRVKTKFIQREMIRLGTELTNRAFDEVYDVSELLEFAESSLYAVGDHVIHKEPIQIGRLLGNTADLISLREKSEIKLTGVPSGMIELDRITLGWQSGDLIILASRPSMGKSALGIQFARKAAQLGKPTLMFSLEMTDIQLSERYLSAETNINTYDMKQGKNIDWTKVEKALSQNSRTPLWIDDSARMNIYEFRSKVRRAKKKYGVELVICDYLNLFKGDEDLDNMSEKYGSISKMFKAVAKECGVAVIALAQLNRGVEGRSEKFPKLADLRNSGEIEQDADLVIFPVRYAVVGIPEDERGNDLSHVARLDVAKNRNGRLGIVRVKVSDDSLQWGNDDDPFMTQDFTEPTF